MTVHKITYKIENDNTPGKSCIIELFEMEQGPVDETVFKSFCSGVWEW